MPEIGLLIAAAAVFAYAVIAQKLSVWIVTPPLAFLGVGYALDATGVLHAGGADEALHVLAEATLVIVLFSDAAMIDLRALSRDHVWPARMLFLGLPLAIAFGTVLVLIVFPTWSLWEAALLAAVLAPTDAALGQAVVTNPVVPERVRRALAVESGLNDGLALPIILFLGCAAVGGQHDFVQDSWLVFAAEQIGFGVVAGCVIGIGGGWMMRFAARRKWTNEAFEGIGVLALAGIAYFAAVEAGGNGFVAAFIGGLGFGHMAARRCRFVFEFMETEGQALVLLTFLLIGAALLPEAASDIGWPALVVIMLSLVVVRPAAIWLSLAGAGAAPVTKAFLGWFGPRGLATALFALLVVGEFGSLAVGPVILKLCVGTVALSAVLHGITANPGARWYGGYVARMKPCPEHMPIANSARPIRTHGAPATEPEGAT